jgi:hypothetical protein
MNSLVGEEVRNRIGYALSPNMDPRDLYDNGLKLQELARDYGMLSNSVNDKFLDDVFLLLKFASDIIISYYMNALYPSDTANAFDDNDVTISMIDTFGRYFKLKPGVPVYDVHCINRYIELYHDEN